MDKLLFGDNQFFGINHMSEEKARAQAMRFQRTDAIMDVLDVAYDSGFVSKSTFNSAFKRFTGLTPSAFKREHVCVEEVGS